MKKPKRAESPKQPQEMLVNVILDRSGSMESNRSGTIAGYNEYLNGLRADKQTRYSISLIQFDSPSNGPELTVSYTDKPLADIADLKTEEYQPRGMTPLYDAIGECTRRVEAKGRPVLAVIITDGMENASREFSKDAIKKLIQEKEVEGWKFAFLGANIDSFEVGGSIGVAASYTANYAPGQEQVMYATMASATVARSACVAKLGTTAANKVPMFSQSQRTAMMGGTAATPHSGGRPAAPPKFRPPVRSQRTQWSVNG